MLRIYSMMHNLLSVICDSCYTQEDACFHVTGYLNGHNVRVIGKGLTRDQIQLNIIVNDNATEYMIGSYFESCLCAENIYYECNVDLEFSELTKQDDRDKDMSNEVFSKLFTRCLEILDSYEHSYYSQEYKLFHIKGLLNNAICHIRSKKLSANDIKLYVKIGGYRKYVWKYIDTISDMADVEECIIDMKRRSACI